MEEAEEIGVEHLLRDIKDSTTTTLATRVAEQLSSLRGLQSRVSDIQKYLVEVAAGTMPLNHQIIYHLQDALNLLPDLSDSSITQSFAFSTAIYGAQVPGYFSAAFLNESLGRRRVIGGYMIFGAVSAGALALAASDQQIMVAAVCLSFFMNGTFGGLYAYTSEIFPTPLRATGMGTSSGIGRLGAIGAPILVGFVFPILGFAGVFGTTMVVLVAGAFVILTFGVSTQGRSLEEI